MPKKTAKIQGMGRGQGSKLRLWGSCMAWQPLVSHYLTGSQETTDTYLQKALMPT